ncbi:fumarate hydratase [Babesia caballi]|uniref:Fumarate hydratase n=1 Tax=Babesia caballi TaxID=5871 RepID=A0AAV4LY96_BABCB|nr:fumarate hydratase [Babesia caballi]
MLQHASLIRAARSAVLRSVRPAWSLRRHMGPCKGCKCFATEAAGPCARQPPQAAETPKFDQRFVDPLKKAGSTDGYEFERLDDLSALIKLVDVAVPSLSRGASAKMLVVPSEAIEKLTERAFVEIMHFLRTEHLRQLRGILDDEEASNNDRFVAMQLIKNACVASGGVLPGCQDTGTAIVIGKRGNLVFSENDEAAIAKGVYNAYVKRKFRYGSL